jgi:alanyl-tRNA synthetase
VTAPTTVSAVEQAASDGTAATTTTTVVSSPPKIAAVTGQSQAAAAASTLNALAKQIQGEGGGNPGLAGGVLEGEEEDEAEEGSFIAVDGCTPSNGQELHFLVERE